MIRIAIPNKGVLSGPSIEILEEIGVKIKNRENRRLYCNTNKENVQIIFARADDIPSYVKQGVADLGFTGKDLIEEKSSEVEDLLDLEFGKCEVMLAVPENEEWEKLKKKKIRIATKLPNISKEFIKKNKLDAEIVELSGAIEVAPYAGIADAIIDQMSTGETLSKNRLRKVETLFSSSTRLIANKKSLEEKKNEVEEIKFSLETVISAKGMKYLMMNVPSEKVLSEIVKEIPSMKSPTVVKLAEEGAYAVHTVIIEDKLLETIRKLKQCGATDILMVNLGKVIK